MESKNNIVLEKYVKGYLETKVDLSKYHINLKSFDNNKNLFDYQQKSLENITRLLIDYYSTNGKKRLFDFYDQELDKETKENLTHNRTNKHFALLKDGLNIPGDKITYEHFLNRASFWMATASGKTLIIVKLIEVLYELMIRKAIPTKKVMIITPNDSIFNQIKNHVDNFNKANFRYKKIVLRDIREYEQREFAGLNPIQPDMLTVYHTNSSVLSDTNKEKMIDYKTYLENNGWYIILDEAHKGEVVESIRKQYINILANNGFLFNFSATFTDELDIISTIANFNLPEFIKSGYGKNIKVLDEEFKNFKAKNKNEQKENLSDPQKRSIILKSLLVYAAVKKNYLAIKDDHVDLYHNPLMLTISNEINTSNADMKLYFEYLSQIASGEVKETEIEELKQVIVERARANLKYSIGEDSLGDIFLESVLSITQKDILKLVFNSESNGTIEVNQIGSNNNELSFRLKTSSKSEPFALIKASDVSKWKNNILKDFTFNDDIVVEQSRFNDIHKKDNEINILMGSRQFIEGWDSNRPNVINFINMGTNDENTKLILQAIGRGVRIEPLPDKRRRFKLTDESIKDFNKQIREKVIKHGELLETLFVFATNKQVVSNILNEITFQDDEWNNVTSIKRTNVKESLKVPVYETIPYNTKCYKISKTDFKQVEDFVIDNSKKLLAVRDDIDIRTIDKVKSQYGLIITDTKSKEDTPINTLKNIENHMRMESKTLIGFREEAKHIDIKHYKYIKTTLSGDDLINMEDYIKNNISGHENKNYNREQTALVNDLISIYEGGKKPSKALVKMAEEQGVYMDDVIQKVWGKDVEKQFEVTLQNIQTHYYKPILLSKSTQFRNVVSEDSEIEFLKVLEDYLKTSKNKVEEYDWWFFSKISEGIDEIYIPYYDSLKQTYRKFYPDFIFWMKKDEQYYIKFVDPKGLLLSVRNTLDKVIGFEELFSIKQDESKFDIKVELLLYNEDDSGDEKLEEYRFNDLDGLFK